MTWTITNWRAPHLPLPPETDDAFDVPGVGITCTTARETHGSSFHRFPVTCVTENLRCLNYFTLDSTQYNLGSEHVKYFVSSPVRSILVLKSCGDWFVDFGWTRRDRQRPTTVTTETERTTNSFVEWKTKSIFINVVCDFGWRKLRYRKIFLIYTFFLNLYLLCVWKTIFWISHE